MNGLRGNSTKMLELLREDGVIELVAGMPSGLCKVQPGATRPRGSWGFQFSLPSLGFIGLIGLIGFRAEDSGLSLRIMSCRPPASGAGVRQVLSDA